jgi:hypothetical protein
MPYHNKLINLIGLVCFIRKLLIKVSKILLYNFKFKSCIYLLNTKLNVKKLFFVFVRFFNQHNRYDILASILNR